MSLGDHVLKSWSISQSVVALSVGEAEYYAMTKCAANGLGLQSLMTNLGVDAKLRILTDSSTGKAISARRGLGKVRHMACHELWLQEHVSAGTIEVVKIKNT